MSEPRFARIRGNRPSELFLRGKGTGEIRSGGKPAYHVLVEQTERQVRDQKAEKEGCNREQERD